MDVNIKMGKIMKAYDNYTECVRKKTEAETDKLLAECKSRELLTEQEVENILS